MYQTLRYEKQENIGILTINRPEALNALNSTVIGDLEQAITEVEKDAELGALIITGEGRSFVAGADIGEQLPLDVAGGRKWGPADVDGAPFCQERMAFFSGLYERSGGASWQEANFALQQIMTEYADCGPHRLRSDTLLTAGIKYIGDLRKKINKEMSVSDAHELMRAAEVLNLLDLGEALMIAARERKESRGRHLRADFTFTNPLLRDKFLRVWQEDGTPRTAWRDRLK